MVSVAVESPKVKVGSLRRHVRGSWFCRLPDGMGTKWFGKIDEATARSLYESFVADLAVIGKEGRATEKAPRAVSRPMRKADSQTFREVADALFALVDSEAGPCGQRNIRY